MNSKIFELSKDKNVKIISLVDCYKFDTLNELFGNNEILVMLDVRYEDLAGKSGTYIITNRHQFNYDIVLFSISDTSQLSDGEKRDRLNNLFDLSHKDFKYLTSLSDSEYYYNNNIQINI